jgi:glutamyl-tRNA reductase
MTLHALGLNHERAPVALRERFALDAPARAALLAGLPLGSAAEAVVLSTCNRTEAVVYGTEHDALAVAAALAVRAGVPWPEADAFHLRDEAAVRHALELTAGLRSLVLGDAQILPQVKDAYRAAVEAERVGPVLHRLLHQAFRAAKRVRTETALAEGAAPVSAAPVAAARAHRAAHVPGARGLDGARVLLVGAGEMGQAALRALAADALADLAVTNRTEERAAEAALAWAGGQAPAGLAARLVPWEERHAAVAAADVVVVASGAAAPVLRAADLPARSGPGVLVVDVAVPRNVEPAVDALPGYTVLDLDRLARTVRATEARRSAAVPAARAVCDEALADFVEWMLRQHALQPTVHALRTTFEAIRRQELDRYAHRFDPAALPEVERLTRSILQKLLAVPVVHLKDAGPDSLDAAAAIRVLSRMFARPGCDEEDAAETAARADADRYEALRTGGEPEAVYPALRREDVG